MQEIMPRLVHVSNKVAEAAGRGILLVEADRYRIIAVYRLQVSVLESESHLGELSRLAVRN